MVGKSRPPHTGPRFLFAGYSKLQFSLEDSIASVPLQVPSALHATRREERADSNMLLIQAPRQPTTGSVVYMWRSWAVRNWTQVLSEASLKGTLGHLD